MMTIDGTQCLAQFCSRLNIHFLFETFSLVSVSIGFIDFRIFFPSCRLNVYLRRKIVRFYHFTLKIYCTTNYFIIFMLFVHFANDKF